MEPVSLNFNPSVSLTYDTSHLSSNIGMVLVFEFLDKIGFNDLVDQTFIYEEERLNPTHTQPQILTQMVYQTIAGFHQDTSANNLRHDRVMLLAFDKSELASQPSLSRFINNLSLESLPGLFQISRQIGKIGLAQASSQEGIIYIKYFQDWKLYLAFDFRTGLVVNLQVNLNGNDPDSFFLDFVESTITDYQNTEAKNGLVIKVDKDFTSQDFYSLCKREGVYYLTSLEASPQLVSSIQDYIKTDSSNFDITKTSVQNYSVDKGGYKLLVEATRPSGDLVYTSFKISKTNLIQPGDSLINEAKKKQAS